MKGFSSKRAALKVDVLQDQETDCLQVRGCITQPGHFTGWGSEGVNVVVPVVDDGLFGHCLCDFFSTHLLKQQLVHKWIHTGGVPTSLTLLFRRWLTISSVFTGWSIGTSYSLGPDPPLSAIPIKPYGFCGRTAP